MATYVGDLSEQQIERLRAEFVELLARRFAYPPFFDHSAGEMRVRPANREKRQEITDFVHRVDFAPLARVEVTSPEVRRFFETLVLGYIDINRALTRRYVKRRVPEMRACALKAVSAIQRGLVAYAQGSAPTYGSQRPAESWAGPVPRAPHASDEELERNTAVLAAVLARSQPITDETTRPGEVVPVRAAQSRPGPQAMSVPVGSVTEPTPETYRMYGEYLDDMNTEQAPTVAAMPVAARGMSDSTFGGAPSGRSSAASSARLPLPSAPAPSQQSAPSAMAAPSTPTSGESRTDEMIFGQLRHQLEAYVRRTARSHGLLTMSGGDPARMLALLRQASRIDEADARLIEGILALTDRVTQQGHSTLADYRQAMMLYLLYHRNHLGE